MTITDSGRRTREQLLEQARKLFASGPLPSKSQFAKALQAHFNTASPVYDELERERHREAVERHRMRRMIKDRKERRPRSGRASRVALGPFVGAPMPAVEEAAGPPDGAAPEVPPQESAPTAHRPVVTWPALLVAAPAAVAIWAGWVAIGKMTGFGPVNLLPGFGRGFTIDTAITLPVGVEAYAGYAFYVALHPGAPGRARRFAAWSALLAVVLGMGGQTAYHLMSAAGMQLAPWQITTVVSCLPVGLFGAVAALIHMVRAGED